MNYEPYDIAYDPLQCNLIINWIFDEYGAQKGGDNVDSLYINFGKIILQDTNILDIFKSEIKSKNFEDIISKMKMLLERVTEIKKIFTEQISLDTKFTTFKTGVKKKSFLLNTSDNYMYNNAVGLDDYIQIVKNLKLTEYDEFMYVAQTCGHAIGTYFKKIDNGNFLFYIINTGDGAQYQNIKDDLLTNAGIMCFEIDSDKINFIYGILFATEGYMSTTYFYNILMRIMFRSQDKFDDVDDIKKKYLSESNFFIKSIDTKLQVMGNCTVVALVNVIEILLQEDKTYSTMISDEFSNLYNKIKIILLYYTLTHFSTTYNLDSVESYKLFIKLNETCSRLRSKYKYELFDNKNKTILGNLYCKYINFIENCTNLENNNEMLLQNCDKIKKISSELDFNVPNEINESIIKKINEQLEQISKKYSNLDFISSFEDIKKILLDLCNYVNLIVYLSDNSFDYLINRYWQYKMILIVNNFYNKFKFLVKNQLLDKDYDVQIIMTCVRYICFYTNSLNIDYFSKFFHKNFQELQFETIKNPNNTFSDYYIKKSSHRIIDDTMSSYQYTIFDTIITNFIKFCGLLYEFQNENKFIDSSDEDINMLKNFNSGYVITTAKDTKLLIEVNEEMIKETNKYFLIIKDEKNDKIMSNAKNIIHDDSKQKNYDIEIITAYTTNKPPEHGLTNKKISPTLKRSRNRTPDITIQDLLGNTFFKQIDVDITHSTATNAEPSNSGNISIMNFFNLFEDEIKSKNCNDTNDFFTYFEENFYCSTDVKWVLLYLNILYYKANFSENNFTHEDYKVSHLSVLTSFNVKFMSTIQQTRITNSDDIINNIEFYLHNANVETEFYNKFGIYYLNYGIIDHRDTNSVFFKMNKENKFNVDINTSIYNKNYFEKLLIKISDMILNNLIAKDCYIDIFNMMISIINLGVVLNVKLTMTDELKSALNVIVNTFNPIIKLLFNFWIETNFDVNYDKIIQLFDKLKKMDKIESSYDGTMDRSFWDGQFALLFNVVLCYSDTNSVLENKLINNNFYYNIIYDHVNDDSSLYSFDRDDSFDGCDSEVLPDIKKNNMSEIDSSFINEYNYYSNYNKNKLFNYEYLTKIKKCVMIDDSNEQLFLIPYSSESIDNEIIKYKNIRFEFKKNMLSYDFYSLNKIYFENYVVDDSAIIISKIKLFKGIDNSYLQICYLSDYSLINNLQYKLSSSNPNMHISTFNDNLVEITLGEIPHITINKNKVLSIVELVTIKNVFCIYVKILSLCNMNINDRESTVSGQTRTYVNNEHYNEIIPVMLDGKIYFNCYQLNIYFVYNIQTEILHYLNDIEIITTKNYYYVNRFVYNTKCLVSKQNEKYSFMVMGEKSKSLNFIQCNNNGIFAEKKLDTLIYFIKEQINAYKVHESNILLINYDQNKFPANKKLDLTLNSFNNQENIYNLYYFENMKSHIIPYIDCLHIFKTNDEISYGMMEYYNFFDFNLVTSGEIIIENCSLLSNPSINSPNVLPNKINLFGALYVYNFLNTSNYSLTKSDFTVKKYISSYQHYNYKKTMSREYNFPLKNHINVKKTITHSDWNNGINLLEDIHVQNDNVEKYYYKINKEILKDMNNEYICDAKMIIDDYENFYNTNTHNKVIDKPNLLKLKDNVLSCINRYKFKINQANIKYAMINFNNMKHLQTIYDFDIVYINLVMLLCKYQIIIEEINLCLSIENDKYIIDKIFNMNDFKPIFIDKVINTGIIIFEYMVGYHIRQKQYDFCKLLFDEILLKNTSGPNFHQMLMGEGKSSVIAPVLTLLLMYDGELDREQKIFHVMPISLINQSYDIFNKIFYYMSRNSVKLIKNDTNSFHNNYKINIISDYLLKYIKLINTSNIFFSMRKNIFIYDEIDEVSDPLKSQLNIISVKPKILDDIDDIYHLIHDFIYKLYFDDKYEDLRINLEKYQFGRIPHLINQGTDFDLRAKKLITDLYIDTIKEVFGINYKKCCEMLLNDVSNDLEKKVCKSLNYDILNIIYKFYKIIPSIIKMLHRRHFGQKYNDLENIKIFNNDEQMTNIHNNKFVLKYYKNFVAVPYSSNETPSEKSEFSDYLITIAFTIITYYDNSSRRIRNLDIQVYLNYIKENYYKNSYLKDIDNPWFKFYNDFTKNISTSDKPVINKNLNVKEFDNKYISMLVDNFNIKIYLLDILLPKVIKNIEEFKNISFIDIIKSDYSPHRIGFTGTPFIHKPFEFEPTYEIKSIQRQKYGDGAIVASILGFTRKSIFYENTNTKDEVINIAIDNGYHCIVDVGSYFINDKNEDIAEKILSKLKISKSKIICVVFIDENHKKMCILESGSIINYDSINVPLQNRFYYFDQSHITGIDVKIYNNAKGLITLAVFNRYRDVAQGIFRMRNINYGQTVDFCFNKNYVVNMNNKKMELITMLIYNEFNYKMSQSMLFYKETILTLYRTFFEQKQIYRLDNISENSSFLKDGIYNQSDKILTISDYSMIKFDEYDKI